MNTRFSHTSLQELARLLPSVAETDPGRLSKHVVLEESITRHKTQDMHRLTAISHIQALTRERDEILAEVNEWRARCGGGFLSPRQALVNNDKISDLLTLEANQSHAQRAQSTSGQSATDAEPESELVSPPTDSHADFMDPSLMPEPTLQPMSGMIIPQAPWAESLDVIPSNESFEREAGQVPESFLGAPEPATDPSMFLEQDHHASLPDISVALLTHDDLFSSSISPGIPDPSGFMPAMHTINHIMPNSAYLYQ